MIKLHNCDNLELMVTLSDESIDVICIDPPYLYLKNQKLERPFDECKFFSECKRLLTKNGFIIMFGRGISFYRWNTLLDGLGFTFKEEIVWDKQQTSSPVLPISRVHETISIFCKSDISINKVKIPYVEAKSYDLSKMIDDINRIKTAFSNNEHFKKVEDYLIDQKRKDYEEERFASKHDVTFSTKRLGNRVVNAANAMVLGMTEKTIIRSSRDHYTSIHPTQKPVRLIERLLALVIPDKPRNEIIVADFFAGSMSTMEAVHNMGMQGIATEIDEEYFLNGEKRIKNLQPIQSKLFNHANRT